MLASLSLTATGLFALTLAACGDPAASGCRVDSDCRTGRICVERQCVDQPVGGLDGGTDDSGGVNNVDPNVAPNNVDPNVSPNNVSPNNVTPGDAGMPDGGDLDAGMPDDGGMTDDAGMPDTGGMTDSGTPDMNTNPVFGAQIEVSPASVDFAFVPTNGSVDAPINVTNIGDAALNLIDVALEATPSTGFAVAASTTTVAPGQTVEVIATFAPQAAGNYGNAVIIQSDDADDPQVRVPLSGRGFDPSFQSCLYTSPAQIDFGPVPVGQTATATVTVGNCSRNDDVEFDAAELVGQTPEFSVSSNAPQTLMPGDTETITVTFTPTSLANVSDQLRVESDAQLGDVSFVDLSGGGGCAEAVALGELDGLPNDIPRPGPIAIVVGSLLNIDGSESTSPSGALDYSWSLAAAPGTSTTALGSTTAAQTSFTPDVAGDYTVELAVSDPNSGAPSCGTTSLEVTALADLPEILVTLEWSADHDMDLHVLRDDGNGNFPAFEDPLDDLHFGALWLDWGLPMDRTDDAYHLGDDSDGNGPENAAIAKLESGRTYRVVAHFARTDGFQPAIFDVDVTAARRVMGAGPASGNITRRFNVTEQGIYWIAFDIDGTNGRITTVNQVTR
jgi:hypothetical protein